MLGPWWTKNIARALDQEYCPALCPCVYLIWLAHALGPLRTIRRDHLCSAFEEPQGKAERLAENSGSGSGSTAERHCLTVCCRSHLCWQQAVTQVCLDQIRSGEWLRAARVRRQAAESPNHGPGSGRRRPVRPRGEALLSASVLVVEYTAERERARERERASLWSRQPKGKNLMAAQLTSAPTVISASTTSVATPCRQRQADRAGRAEGSGTSRTAPTRQYLMVELAGAGVRAGAGEGGSNRAGPADKPQSPPGR
eukprot:SAG22_NODE_1017_length_6016_cov_40.662667_7_plen_255_part_00